MLPIVPIINALMQRKFSVLLLTLQIALTTAIFSNLSFVAQEFDRRYMRPSDIKDDLFFTVLLRPIDSKINYFDALRDISSLQKISGIVSSSIFRWSPFSGSATTGALRAHPDENAPTLKTAMIDVSTQALTTLELNVIAGRDFQMEDMIVENINADNRKAIVTQVLATALFESAQNAIGKTVFEGDTRFEIIGVTRDWTGIGIDSSEPVEHSLFIPHYWDNDPEQRYILRVNNNHSREKVITETIKQLKHNYQNKVFLYIEKMDELKKQTSIPGHKFSILLKTINIVLGLVVAFAISGQTLFSIQQRTKQIGLRRALGASQSDIIILLLVENTIIFAFGLTAGILLALYANQFVIKMGYPSLPPFYLIVTCVSLLALSIVSTVMPAISASKIPPGVVTRTL